MKRVLMIPMVELSHRSWIRYSNMDRILNEGLIMSYPYDLAVRNIKELFDLEDEEIWLERIKNNISKKKIVVKVFNTEANINELDKAFSLYGYIRAATKNSGDEGYVNAYYIPKYTGDVTDYVHSMKYITHISPIYYKEKILQNGFIPKSHNSQYTYNNRVYFFPETVHWDEILFQMNDFENKLKNKRNNGLWSIFTIDTSQITQNVRFQLDPLYVFGIYTFDNIPPSTIINVQDYDINENKLTIQEILEKNKKTKHFKITEEQYNYLIDCKDII